jgi:hypothetical protein
MSSLTVGYAGLSEGSLERSSGDLNESTFGFLHKKARFEAGVTGDGWVFQGDV